MASTRPNPFLQIYQDAETSFEHERIPYHDSGLHPLQPVGNSSFKRNGALNHAAAGHGRPSPSKSSATVASPPRALLNNNFNLISIPPPHPSNAVSASPVKRPSLGTYDASALRRPQKVLFSTFPNPRPLDKENFHPMPPSSENFAEFPDPITTQRNSVKRALLEGPALRERPSKRSKKEEAVTHQLPEPEDMPLVEDDGSKPPYSYATLIGMAILRAPSRRLTLAQIYKWISDTFSYYHNAETGWQNSIRHNLSLNKAFVKQERPKDDPGKGNYWAIEPGMEVQFLKDRGPRRLSAAIPAAATGHSKKEASAPCEPSPPLGVRIERLTSTDREMKLRAELELSSDATLPASDPPLHELQDEQGMPPPSSRNIHSSPPQLIHSSPPVAQHTSMGLQGTPPPVQSVSSTAQAVRSRKRKLLQANDSGYFSSIESSASRPQPARNLLNSDLDIDRPLIKRGRAEEEIARIRHSSHDSPTMARGLVKQSLTSSSPLRHFDSSQMLPPLTPIAAIKFPAKAPKSASPNTHLRNHRDKVKELVGSPLRNVGILTDDLPWSPAFNIDDESYGMDEPRIGAHGELDIFAPNAEDIFSRPSYLSPTKHSAKRPRLDRANTTANVLGDGNNNINHFASPAVVGRAFTATQTPYTNLSPSKSYSFQSNILDLTQDDIFDGDLFMDATSPEDDVDILRGFQKIGKGKEDHVSPNPRPRPKLGVIGRSLTSRF